MMDHAEYLLAVLSAISTHFQDASQHHTLILCLQKPRVLFAEAEDERPDV